MKLLTQVAALPKYVRYADGTTISANRARKQLVSKYRDSSKQLLITMVYMKSSRSGLIVESSQVIGTGHCG